MPVRTPMPMKPKRVAMPKSRPRVPLKNKINGERPQHVCAISRCKLTPDVTDGTRQIADEDLPLCTAHWMKYTPWEKAGGKA